MGSSSSTISKPSPPKALPNATIVRTGNGLAWIIGLNIFFAVAIMSTAAYALSKTSEQSYQRYGYIVMVVFSIIIILICIWILLTIVRSLMIEDIMVSSIQRMILGDIDAKDFQERAGYYFKNKIVNSSTTDSLNSIGMAKYIGKVITEGVTSAAAPAPAPAPAPVPSSPL